MVAGFDLVAGMDGPRRYVVDAAGEPPSPDEVAVTRGDGTVRVGPAAGG